MDMHGFGSNTRRTQGLLWMGIGLAAIAGVVALRMAVRSRQRHHRALHPVRDYSGRRGFPLPVQEMRGAARYDFEMPDDMRSQPRLRAVDSA
ncbi:hypothetical protein [Piscinibacter sp. XHJ-5]|uniref:hypothetical protein n=1 Tax=Piscinibacter sp. XHJ-5 TaxID=3037797 RepID=UPI002453232B|nr:hypothetical protein [Piscinibacter sp. XHJ-5]